MKRINFLTIITAITFCTGVSAQTFQIDTSEITFENKLRPCLDVKYDASPKDVKKAWAGFMKKNYKIKVKGISLLTDKDIISASDVTINTIANKRMDMYARITDIPRGSEMKYFMAFGYDFFIGPEKYPNEFEGMKKLLNDFSVEFLNDYYKSESSSVLKQIKGYEKDISKKNKGIAKNIKKSSKGSEAEKSATEAKNNALNLDIQQLQTKIDDLKKELDTIKEKQGGIIAN